MELCGFFDAEYVNEQYDRVYVADTFASYFASFIGNGVFNNKESEIIMVKEDSPKGMRVIVTPGQAWINGYWYKNTDNLTLNISIADGLRNRIDSVVLRWDKLQRNMYVTVLEGELAANPVAPLPVRDSNYFDLLLATININAGTENIAQRLITDTRMNKAVCGFVTSVVDQVDTTTLYQQFEDFYNNFVTVEAENFVQWANIQKEEFVAWFDGIKDILDEKVVTNILNLIEKARLNIAPDFDAATQYEVGDYLHYENILYKCTERYLGEWDGSKFEVVNVGDELSDLSNNVNSLNSDVNTLKNTVSGHTTTLGEYGTRLTNVESKASTNASNISTLQSTVSGHTTTLSGYGTRLTNVENKASTNETNITNKMNKSNPIGTGYFSLNRKSGTTIGTNSFAEGYNTTAIGTYSHAEGNETTARGNYSHAEGYNTTASSNSSHAEGYNTTASGNYSHAEGESTTAYNYASHAEGRETTAEGSHSHAEGWKTTASENGSHAEGSHTTASNYASHACGKYNKAMTTGGSATNQVGTAFLIGNGTGISGNVSNAFSVQYSGVVKAQSTITGSTPADYAEFFEWKDKNKDNEDRVGYFVTLDGDKIKKANNKDEYILGIISGEPFVLGNGDCDMWNGAILRDEFRRPIWEPAPEIDEETGKEKLDKNGNIIYNGERMKINPEYNPEEKYISRYDRPEWSPVGMLGVLAVRQDGTLKINGYATVNKDGIATSCDFSNNKCYRVINVVNDEVAEVIFR